MGKLVCKKHVVVVEINCPTREIAQKQELLLLNAFEYRIRGTLSKKISKKKGELVILFYIPLLPQNDVAFVRII